MVEFLSYKDSGDSFGRQDGRLVNAQACQESSTDSIHSSGRMVISAHTTPGSTQPRGPGARKFPCSGNSLGMALITPPRCAVVCVSAEAYRCINALI